MTSPLRFKPAYLILMLIVLALYVADKGVLPAMKGIDSDFPNYYVSARVVLEGHDPARLYEDAWFQQQIYDHGIPRPGKFSPFPPATAFIMLPLVRLTPLAALRVVTVLNVAMLVASALLLSRITDSTRLEASVFVLLSGMGLVNCFRLGQLYIAVSFLILLGIWCLERRKQAWAGACLGLPVPFKYFPSIYLVYFAAKGRWRLAITGAAVAAGIFAAGIAILGWPVHAAYLQSVLPRHLQSELSLQDPFSPAFQSFDSLLKRLFLYNASLNPGPFVRSRELYLTFKTAILLSLTTSLAWGIYNAEHGAPEHRQKLSIALLGIWGLLIAPASATYHFVLLWLPVGYLLSDLRQAGRQVLYIFGLSVYLGIGFVPYNAFRSWQGRGIFVLAAYPRLWLMCALFCIALAAAADVQRASCELHETKPTRG